MTRSRSKSRKTRFEAEIRSRSLQELEGDDWGDPENAPTGLVARCLRLRRAPLGELRPSDVRQLVNQNIGLPRTMPLALELLEAAPLIETIFYPGDLLRAVLTVEPSFWLHQTELHDRALAVVRSIGDGELAQSIEDGAPEEIWEELQRFLDRRAA